MYTVIHRAALKEGQLYYYSQPSEKASVTTVKQEPVTTWTEVK